MSVEKRVLFLVDKSGFGGVQTIAYSLIARGVPDVDISFFFLRNINDRFGMQDIVRPDVRYASATRRYSLLPFLDIIRQVRERKIDILHLNGNKSVIFGVLLKTLIFHRLKLVAHDHGGVFDNAAWYTDFLRLSRHRINVFVTVSEHRKRLLMERSGAAAHRIVVINNFVDPDRLGLLGEAVTRPAQAPDRPYVVGYVGGLSRIKGCDILIAAVPRLKETIPNLKVVIAGDGPARQELEALATQLGVSELVTFLGFVDHPGETYAGFDIMVIPSRSEEGPICLYEAWLMKLPVVASNAKVLDERIRDGETGLFFQSEDSRDLADKILRLKSDPGLADRLGAKGAQEAKSHTVDQYQSSLRTLYLSL